LPVGLKLCTARFDCEIRRSARDDHTSTFAFSRYADQ
jgi:hypothetical protein